MSFASFSGPREPTLPIERIERVTQVFSLAIQPLNIRSKVRQAKTKCHTSSFTFGVIHFKATVGDSESARVLRDLKHFRTQSR